MLEDRVVLLTYARHFVEPAAPDYWRDTGRPSSVTTKNLRMPRNETLSRMSSPGTIAVATQEPEDVVGAALDEQGRIDALISNDAYPAVRAPVDEADKEEMRRAMEALVVWPHR